jgi:hypothetical protein
MSRSTNLTRSPRTLTRLATVLAVLLLGVSSMTASAWAASSLESALNPGACGSVLAAGSSWLNGLGVNVISNGPDQGTGTSCGGTTQNTVYGIPSGYEWQCTELVNRLYLTWGWITSTWSGNGGDSSPTASDSMYDLAPSSLTKQANGSISSVGPGDVVSVNEYHNGVFVPDGHVFIVNSSGTVTSGTVNLVSQNYGGSSNAIVRSTATLSGGTLTVASSGGWSYSIIGVVHAPPHALSGWRAADAPLPADAQTPNNAQLSAVTCPSSTSCVAVGSYTDSSGTPQILVVTGWGASWTAAEASLPADAGSSPELSLSAVACPSTTSCTAIGSYLNSSGNTRGLLVTGAGASWTATAAPLPANAVTTGQTAQLSAVACPSTTSCVAVGSYYLSSSASPVGLLVTGSGTSWTASEAPEPANAPATNQDAPLSAVACPSTSSCVAVGSYTDSSDNEDGLLVTGSGTSWTAAEAPSPTEELSAVTCPAVTSCVAAGDYISHGYSAPLLVTGSGASWAATEAPLPPDAVGGQWGTGLSGVACLSTTSCVAVGSYTNGSAPDSAGLLETGSGTSWTATEAPLPAKPSTSYIGYLSSAACASSACVAIGIYTAKVGNGVYQPMLVTGSGTTWKAQKVPLPANSRAGTGGLSPSVACRSAGACVTVGNYADQSGGTQGLLVMGPP